MCERERKKKPEEDLETQLKKNALFIFWCATEKKIKGSHLNKRIIQFN